ncbi:hypothetical protein N8T22_10905, partial [Enterobacter hormaechei subsp. steigerwaltii]|nr:hypothetical protein [Enterobacter hormaechei subsp. steigerwaltii]
FGFAENTDDLFIGKTLLHGDVLMWLMKTLLTSRCINQRGAGQGTFQSLIQTKEMLRKFKFDEWHRFESLSKYVVMAYQKSHLLINVQCTK